MVLEARLVSSCLIFPSSARPLRSRLFASRGSSVRVLFRVLFGATFSLWEEHGKIYNPAAGHHGIYANPGGHVFLVVCAGGTDTPTSPSQCWDRGRQGVAWDHFLSMVSEQLESQCLSRRDLPAPSPEGI